MAFLPRYLSGLIAIDQLVAQTGLSPRRLTRYLTGAAIPRLPTLNVLKKAYTQVQTERLFASGMPEKMAKRLADNAPKTVSHMVNQTNESVRLVTAKVNLKRAQKGKDFIDEAAITVGMQNTRMTEEEIWEYLEKGNAKK